MSIGKRRIVPNLYFENNDELVYVVWYDNGEPYEDNYSCIDRIFSSWKEAEEWLNSNDLVRHEETVWKYVPNPGSWKVLTPRWYRRDPLDSCPDEMWEIEIWNLKTGMEVPFDDEHILLINDKANLSLLETLESRQ